MTRVFIARMATVAGVLTLSTSCTMKDQDAPPLTGPSEFSQSVSVTVSPDVLPQDGASQSFITVTARDSNSQPLRNVSMRTETRVNGTAVDFGVLSARNIVTGSDGRATLVYTAPPSPAVSPDNFIVVDIVVIPFGSDFNNASARTAAIRLVPQGPVIPPFNLQAAFTFTPAAPSDGQPVLFDASSSSGAIASYEWNFGDGERGSGRTDGHDYAAPGTYIVTLTVMDSFGRTASQSQSITVGQGTQPVADFVFSPSAPFRNQAVNFNASASRAAPGGRIESYTWDFGDGSARVTTGSVVQQHSFAVAATYNVTLVVTDNAGRTATKTFAVTIAP